MRFTDLLVRLPAFLAPSFEAAKLRTASLAARCGRTTLVSLLLACTLAACGGSGSSGFDGAIDSEAEAIEVATREGICVEFDGTTWCGSGAPLDVDGGTAVVEFDESEVPVPCTDVPGTLGCQVSVGFVSSGFPEGTFFLPASAADESGPWDLSPVESPTSPNGDVVVLVPDFPGAPTPGVLAVLVYFDGPPDDLQEMEVSLADFDPDVVYLTSGVEVAPPSSE